MKKIISLIAAAAIRLSSLFVTTAFAGNIKYKVVNGDTMWKISRKFEIGLDELIAANPQIADPDLIYPDQVLTVPTKDDRIAGVEAEVVRLVNVERQNRGLPPLTIDRELSQIARYKAQDMHDGGYFSHQSPTYGSPFEMIRSFGLTYRTAGENIARGYASAAEVVNAWMNSTGHRANILNEGFTKIGIGYVSDGNYWVQMFIG